MGTRERRQRDFEEREQQFLACARELIAENGLLNLQMSKVAERCEYAVGTLYQHFSSKEDLLLGLVTRDVAEHTALFHRVADWRAPSRERMFAVGVADMIFVNRHPDFFRLSQYSLCEVVWKAASPERRQSFVEVTQPIGAIVVSIVEDAVARGDLQLREQSAQELASGLWALCSGYHQLVHTDGVLEDFSVCSPYRAMCRHMTHLLDGMGWQPVDRDGSPEAQDALIKRICNEVFDETICAG
jgi:AcrR family transcriptional regulator